jgi:hypothetical protein
MVQSHLYHACNYSHAKEIALCYAIRRSATIFTTDHHMALSCAISMQLRSSQSASVIY